MEKPPRDFVKLICETVSPGVGCGVVHAQLRNYDPGILLVKKIWDFGLK
jgi:hypothetical protein